MKCRRLLLVGIAASAAALAVPGVPRAASASGTRTAIKHVVVIVQENHSFDSYFANYCRSRVDAKHRPVCDGGPRTYPGTMTPPVVLAPLLLTGGASRLGQNDASASFLETTRGAPRSPPGGRTRRNGGPQSATGPRRC
jgi:Phosphoesterase family